MPGTHQDADALRSELPADLTSARQARSAVRTALAAWGMTDPSGDAELLASELVANAAQHGRGPIGLSLTRHREPGGLVGITCEVADTCPQQRRALQAGPGDERGRGLAIVTALATASGVRAEPAGKTTWFTLALANLRGSRRAMARLAGRGSSSWRRPARPTTKIGSHIAPKIGHQRAARLAERKADGP